MESNFVWTDELVSKIVAQAHRDAFEAIPLSIFDRISDFKKSHTPALERNPLFTTIQGKDIFEGDEYWYLENWEGKKGIADKLHSGAFPTFSTEESVNEYILLNKPVLSFKDVIGMFDEGINIVGKNWSSEKLKQLAKSKIDKQSIGG